MTTTYWTGNGQATAGVVTLTVTAVAVGGTLTATINGKSVTYTCVTGDSVTSAATAWFVLLSNQQTAPPEFNQLAWANPSAGVITATGPADGRPFVGVTGGLTTSGGGGATVAQTTTTASSSPSDVGLAANWLRAGSPSLPQNGDDVVVSDGSVPLLYNLSALSAVQFATYTRWQSFTGQVGLPENNVLGYFEFLPSYFKFSGPPAGTLPVLLGQGTLGTGPTLERYDVGAQHAAFDVRAAGAPQGDYAVRLLGSSASNTLSVVGTSVAVAMLPGETAALTSATVDGGGTLDLGSGCAVSGTVTFSGSSGNVYCAPNSLTLVNGSSVVVLGAGLTYATVIAEQGSSVTWLSDSNVTALVLQTGSVLDTSGSVRPFTVTTSGLDGDCRVLDPNGNVTWTNATTMRGAVLSGPFLLGPNRSIKVT